MLFLLLFRGNVMSTLFAIEAGVLVWLLALGATWLGTSNSIREIVKEQPIYRRERAIGLSTSAYLASKMLLLAPLTLLQTTVMTLDATSGQETCRPSIPRGWHGSSRPVPCCPGNGSNWWGWSALPVWRRWPSGC